MKIYCFSGLGADKRVFEELQLNCELIHIEWLPVTKTTTIEHYASQLSCFVNSSEDHILMGVSFGGLITLEVSKITKPRLTILISSAEVRSELKPLYKLVGKIQLTRLIPSILIKPPAWVLAFVFGTKKKKLLKDILNDSDPYFMKWAIHQLCIWKNTERGLNVLKISGEKDKLMRINEGATIIKDGKHLMIMDCAEGVSNVIKQKLTKIKPI